MEISEYNEIRENMRLAEDHMIVIARNDVEATKLLFNNDLKGAINQTFNTGLKDEQEKHYYLDNTTWQDVRDMESENGFIYELGDGFYADEFIKRDDKNPNSKNQEYLNHIGAERYAIYELSTDMVDDFSDEGALEYIGDEQFQNSISLDPAGINNIEVVVNRPDQSWKVNYYQANSDQEPVEIANGEDWGEDFDPSDEIETTIEYLKNYQDINKLRVDPLENVETVEDRFYLLPKPVTIGKQDYNYLEAENFQTGNPAYLISNGPGNKDYSSMMLTTNVGGRTVFDTNNSSMAIKQLEDNGVLELSSDKLQSGYASYPFGDIDLSKVQRVSYQDVQGLLDGQEQDRSKRILGDYKDAYRDMQREFGVDEDVINDQLEQKEQPLLTQELTAFGKNGQTIDEHVIMTVYYNPESEQVRYDYNSNKLTELNSVKDLTMDYDLDDMTDNFRDENPAGMLRRELLNDGIDVFEGQVENALDKKEHALQNEYMKQQGLDR